MKKEEESILQNRINGCIGYLLEHMSDIKTDHVKLLHEIFQSELHKRQIKEDLKYKKDRLIVYTVVHNGVIVASFLDYDEANEVSNSLVKDAEKDKVRVLSTYCYISREVKSQ